VILGGVALACGGVADAKKRRRKKGKRDKAPRHEAILRDLFAQMEHGWRDEGTAPAELLRRIDHGERIVAICGTLSAVSALALTREGFHARVVGTLTHEPFVNYADGHILMEVRAGGRWLAYDPSFNTQAVDAQGHGISVVELCEAHPRYWRTLTDDPLTHEGTVPPTWPETETWYDRVLGTPWVKDAAGYNVFHDPANRERIESTYAWARYVDAETWHALIA
jgi:hypothetical protein